MPRIAFADESGIDPKCGCYGIGVVTLDVEDRASFEQSLSTLKTAHGVGGEAKWTKIRKGHGAINFILAGLDLIIRTPSASFDAIVVKKSLYNNWQGGQAKQDTAFYQTYTWLLRHIARRAKGTTEVLIDAKSDKYPKHHEVVQTIGNRMLARLATGSTLGTVTKVDSKDCIGVQLADVLTGAVNSAHLLATQPISIHAGKQLAIARIAQQLGWDHLAYDTYPHAKFNVWHFPQEYRGPSRDPVFSGTIPYVIAADVGAG